MNPKNYALVIMSLLFISLSGCTKDKITPYKSLNDFYKNQLNPDTFVMNSDDNISIEGSKGTNLFIPLTALGGVEGPVTITFAELFSKSDLVLNNIPTNARNNTWLESGGSFFFDIRDSTGKEVWLSENLSLRFPVMETISNPNNMGVWFDFQDTRTDFRRWNSVEDGTASVGRELTTYYLFTPPFPWINCDYIFESSAPRVKVGATLLTTNINLEEIRTFIVFKNINAVLRLNQDDRNFESFDIPVREEAHLIMMGYDDGDFYLKIEPFTVAANQNFEIEMEQVSEEALIEAIKLLD